MRNPMEFVSWKDRKGLATALKDIYRAVDADAAEKALTAFAAGPWGQRYPAIGQSWRRARAKSSHSLRSQTKSAGSSTPLMTATGVISAYSTPVRFFVRLQVSCFFAPAYRIPRATVSRRSQAWPVRWRHDRLRGFQATP